MRVKATFQHVFQVTREVEVDDEDLARLQKHQANRDRDTSDEYLIPLHLNTREVEYLAEVFPDWKTSAPLPDDFVLQYTDVIEAERVLEASERETSSSRPHRSRVRVRVVVCSVRRGDHPCCASRVVTCCRGLNGRYGPDERDRRAANDISRARYEPFLAHLQLSARADQRDVCRARRERRCTPCEAVRRHRVRRRIALVGSRAA